MESYELHAMLLLNAKGHNTTPILLDHTFFKIHTLMMMALDHYHRRMRGINIGGAGNL